MQHRNFYIPFRLKHLFVLSNIFVKQRETYREHSSVMIIAVRHGPSSYLLDYQDVQIMQAIKSLNFVPGHGTTGSNKELRHPQEKRSIHQVSVAE